MGNNSAALDAFKIVLAVGATTLRSARRSNIVSFLERHVGARAPSLPEALLSIPCCRSRVGNNETAFGLRRHLATSSAA